MIDVVAHHPRQGTCLVAVSRGGASAGLGMDDEIPEAVPPPVTIRSQVGARNAMMAGIIWADSRGFIVGG